MARWQPIDTAPKDGSPVLLYLPARIGTYGPIEAMYAVAEWRAQGWDGGGWFRETGSSWTHDGCVSSGVVWQPVPKPPVIAAE